MATQISFVETCSHLTNPNLVRVLRTWTSWIEYLPKPRNSDVAPTDWSQKKEKVEASRLFQTASSGCWSLECLSRKHRCGDATHSLAIPQLFCLHLYDDSLSRTCILSIFTHLSLSKHRFFHKSRREVTKDARDFFYLSYPSPDRRACIRRKGLQRVTDQWGSDQTR